MAYFLNKQKNPKQQLEHWQASAEKAIPSRHQTELIDSNTIRRFPTSLQYIILLML